MWGVCFEYRGVRVGRKKAAESEPPKLSRKKKKKKKKFGGEKLGSVPVLRTEKCHHLTERENGCRNETLRTTTK